MWCKTTASLLIAFLFFRPAQGQDAQQRFQQMYKDSAYVDLYDYVKKLSDYNPGNKALYSYRLSLKASLNEWEDMCRYNAEAKLKGIALQSYLKHYQTIHCLGNVKLMPKSIRKMYAQKNQTEKNGYKSEYTKEDSLRGTLNKWRSCYNVVSYDLQLRIDTKKHTIAGHNTIYFVLDSLSDKIQIDAHKGLAIDSLVYKHQKLDFIREGNALFLKPPSDLTVNSLASLTVYYHGKPANAKNPPWEGGFVWKKSDHSNVWAGVACEQLGASFWWPCKDHPSDEPDSMQMRFEVPAPYKVISNGTLVQEKELSDGYLQYTWKVKNPINNYNATFYIGRFSHYTEKYVDINGVPRDLKFYFLSENEEKAKTYFPLSLEVMRVYEQLFGEYPFWSDGYALVESPYAGMEHQSAIAIGAGYGKSEHNEYIYKVVKDDHLIVHETAHEWWGNSLTANDMADAWLQEGFATFAEFLFFEKKYGPEVYLQELDHKRMFVLNLWPLLGNRGVNDNAFIGSDIYYKGALLLQNVRASIDNDSVFFETIKSFATTYKHKTVSTELFMDHVKEKAGRDLDPLFNAYLKQVEIPVLVYSFVKKKDHILLKCRWRNAPKDLVMPFTLKLSNGEYKKLELGTESKTIRLEGAQFFNFINNHIHLKNCPASYYVYFDTFLEQ